MPARAAAPAGCISRNEEVVVLMMSVKKGDGGEGCAGKAANEAITPMQCSYMLDKQA
jgi:hypothetical protein